MRCIVCSGSMEYCFTAQVLEKYAASYNICNECGYLAVHDPRWLEEAYARVITTADTGLLMRNISIAPKVAGVLYWLMGERGNGRYVDIAGGYGIFTRLMRDLGFDYYWSDKYCENLFASGFEYSREFGPCRAATAIEVLEHLSDPVNFIEETLSFTGAQAFIFTTELFEGSPPLPGDWNYYAFSTGQHISFFQRRTLKKIASRLGLRFSSTNGIHIYSKTGVNNILLWASTGLWFPKIASLWVRFRLGSKTVNDHEAIMQRVIR